MGGPQYDDVEINLEGERNHPAKLICFLGATPTVPMGQEPPLDDASQEERREKTLSSIYAIVQYYDVLEWQHPILQQPHCVLSNPRNYKSYHLIGIDTISYHAHMIPDFDCAPDFPRSYYWDRLVVHTPLDDSFAV